MTADFQRRIARLEATQGSADVMVERELSDEGKELLREVLTDLHPPDLIEQFVNRKMLSPPLALSPAGKQHLADMLGALPASGACDECTTPPRRARRGSVLWQGDRRLG